MIYCGIKLWSVTVIQGRKAFLLTHRKLLFPVGCYREVIMKNTKKTAAAAEEVKEAVRTVETKAEEEVKKAVEEVKEEAAAAADTAEKAAEEVRKTVKKTRTTKKSGTAAKKVEEAVEKAEETAKKAGKKVSEAAGKTTKAVKTAAKKAAEKNTVQEVISLQYLGKDIQLADLMKQVHEIWTGELGKSENEIKSINLYLKPEDNAAYYVINESFTGRIDF